ncbi:MAG: thioredoxin family protein [Elusimicrobia bacterium]|nr:thioredoxin family protein [Elusimicrobiota bacterium]
MKIEIAGPGCIRCKTTEKNVLEAIKELGIAAEVTKVSDIREMAKKGVMMTPAVIIDGVVKVSGKIPSVEEIKNILSQGR